MGDCTALVGVMGCGLSKSARAGRLLVNCVLGDVGISSSTSVAGGGCTCESSVAARGAFLDDFVFLTVDRFLLMVDEADAVRRTPREGAFVLLLLLLPFSMVGARADDVGA